MGACSVGGQFTAYDWKEGIQLVQQNAAYEYGNDPYNGAENNVSFSYAGDISNLTKAQHKKYVDELFKGCSKCQGFVYKIGTEGFHIITTKFKETPKYVGELGWIMTYTQEQAWFKQYKRPCILVSANNNGYGYCIAGGTISERKTKAHMLLRKNSYRQNFYIVRKGKDTYIDCGGNIKTQKNTRRKTDEKTLVLELNKYEYVGIAPE